MMKYSLIRSVARFGGPGATHRRKTWKPHRAGVEKKRGEKTMTSTKELNELMTKIEAKGGKVVVEWDTEAEILEGRKIYKRITVTNLKGCGSFPMSPIYAAEKMRDLLVA